MDTMGRMRELLLRRVTVLVCAALVCLALVPSASAVVLEPGDLIVADFNGAWDDPAGPATGGHILRVNPTTGAQTMISSGGDLDAPYDLGIDAAGNIIVLDKDRTVWPSSGQIIKVNPADGSQAVISEAGLFVNPMGLAIDASGQIIVADQQYATTGGIIKVDPITGAQTVIASGGSISVPSDVTIDGAGNLYVTSAPTKDVLAVVKVHPVTGAQTVMSSNPAPCWYSGILFHEETGNVFVDELYHLNGVIRVDLSTGVQTTLTSGINFQDPYNLDSDAAGDLVVADSMWYGAGRIIKVDPVTGAQTLISSGGLLVDPAGIAVYPIPEPATLSLLALSGLGLLARRRRRR